MAFGVPVDKYLKYVLAYLFVASTWMDFLTTYLFMRGVPDPDLEANPVAAWFLRHHGFCGLAWAVITCDVFVIGLLLYAWTKKRKTAFVGFAAACVVSNSVVIHNLVALCSLLRN
jgi:hypothetical protein